LAAKIRIGFNARYLRDYNLRGFNRYTLSLLTELQNRGEFELVLFTDKRSPIHPAFAEAIRAEIVEITSPRVLIWEQLVLPMAFRRHHIDLFHALADGGLPAWKTCPYVLTYHHAPDKSLKHFIARGELSGRMDDYLDGDRGINGQYLKRRAELLRWIYLHSANRIIAVSRYGKWELVELLGVPEEKVEIIYEAADASFSPDVPRATVEEARARYDLPRRYLLFVSGFDRRKNVPGLLRAFHEAKRTGVQEALVLVGTGGDLPAAKLLARTLGLREGRDIVFLQRIHDELPAVYCGATAFVTLSWSESFCLPMLEAMSCGTPIIASNRGAIPEIMRDGGILVDPRNRDGAVQAIKEVTSRTDLRTKLRAEALKRAKEFSWQKTAEQTTLVYREILDCVAQR